MSQTKTIEVPDIGDFKDVEIIEVLVQPGSEIAPEDPLNGAGLSPDISAAIFRMSRHILKEFKRPRLDASR